MSDYFFVSCTITYDDAIPKVKILIITRTFYPATNPRSFRSSELAMELARHHDVTVMMPNSSEAQLDYASQHGFSIDDLGKLKLRPVMPSSNKIVDKFKRVVRRLGSLLMEYPDIELTWRVARRLRVSQEYDLVISVAMPYTIHWGVARAISRVRWQRCTWVADCGDPYYLLQNDTFKKPFYFKYIEKWAFRRFDYITIPIETAKEYYFEEFHNKIRIIPQAFKFEDVPQTATSNRDSSCPHFAYGGSVNPKVRNPRELIEYLLDKDLQFKFVVYTSNGHIIQDLVDRSSNRVEIRPILPRLAFLAALKEYDFVVNVGYRNDGQQPSKLIDYALSGKPILSYRTGAFDAEVVDEFMRGDYTRAYVVENIDQYRIENVARRFLELASNAEGVEASSRPAIPETE